MILSSPHELAVPATRIVSLVPSQTELLHYLGLETETMGITKFCIHPAEWFQSKIRVGGTKNVDIHKVRDMRPNLIIANKEENVKEQIELLASECPVWITEVNTLSDAEQMILDIGELTGREPRANQLVHDIRLGFFSLQSTTPIPACYLIWKDPIMVAAAGTFIDDMMTKAGFENVFAVEERYPVKSMEDIQAANPPVILFSSEPYPFKQTHMDEFQKDIPGCLPILVDGEMFSWYGSRLLKAPAYFHALRQQLFAILR